ncbi:hypothetical protein [Comamonas sp. JC664]
MIAETDRDPGDGKLHVRFSYAAVLEDPSHNPTNQLTSLSRSRI